MLLYLCSALVRLLLVNAVGLRMVLSGVLSLEEVIPSLVCNRPVLSPIPDASVSSYRSLVPSYNFMHTSSFISDFTSRYRVWYNAFLVHTVLIDISFQSGSHVLVVLGENLHK